MPIPKLIVIPDHAALLDIQDHAALLDIQDDDSAHPPSLLDSAEGDDSQPDLLRRHHSNSASLIHTNGTNCCEGESCSGVRRWQANGSCTCKSAEISGQTQLPERSSRTQNLLKRESRRQLQRTLSLPSEDKPPRMPTAALRRAKTSIPNPPRYPKRPTAPSA